MNEMPATTKIRLKLNKNWYEYLCVRYSWYNQQPLRMAFGFEFWGFGCCNSVSIVFGIQIHRQYRVLWDKRLSSYSLSLLRRYVAAAVCAVHAYVLVVVLYTHTHTEARTHTNNGVYFNWKLLILFSQTSAHIHTNAQWHAIMKWEMGNWK